MIGVFRRMSVHGLGFSSRQLFVMSHASDFRSPCEWMDIVRRNFLLVRQPNTSFWEAVDGRKKIFLTDDVGSTVTFQGNTIRTSVRVLLYDAEFLVFLCDRSRLCCLSSNFILTSDGFICPEKHSACMLKAYLHEFCFSGKSPCGAASGSHFDAAPLPIKQRA